MNGSVLTRGRGTIDVSIVKVPVSSEGYSAFSAASLRGSFASGRSISRITQSPGGNHTSRRNLIITYWKIKSDSNMNSLSGLLFSTDSIIPLIQSRNSLLATPGKGFFIFRNQFHIFLRR